MGRVPTILLPRGRCSKAVYYLDDLTRLSRIREVLEPFPEKPYATMSHFAQSDNSNVVSRFETKVFEWRRPAEYIQIIKNGGQSTWPI